MLLLYWESLYSCIQHSCIHAFFFVKIVIFLVFKWILIVVVLIFFIKNTLTSHNMQNHCGFRNKLIIKKHSPCGRYLKKNFNQRKRAQRVRLEFCRVKKIDNYTEIKKERAYIKELAFKKSLGQKNFQKNDSFRVYFMIHLKTFDRFING